MAFWVWTMIDMNRRRFIDRSDRTKYLLMILFFPLIGSFLYLQIRNTLTSAESRVFKPKFNRY
ncbi:MAG: PLDc N-terminal domain-containing protein [Aquaticitalea sp.]